MSIKWAENTVTIIDDIRGVIGRDITFYYVASSTPCPNVLCSLDPVTNTSTNSFCETCSGDYWIAVYSGYTVSGHVTWGPADIVGWATGGQMMEGDCRVQIKYTPEAVTVLDSTEYVLVDGKTMDIRKRILRGVKEINRILLDLIEKEK